MIVYRCGKCNLTTELSECPHCNQRTDMVSSSIYWCKECNVPLFEEACHCCGQQGTQIATDLRPVFPEERLLIEIILGEPLKYQDSSVWSSGSGLYIVDGQKVKIPIGETKQMDIENIRAQLEQYQEQNSFAASERYIRRFIAANKKRFDFLTAEAFQYINEVVVNYDATERYVSFSGGKDSTVVSSLVMRALGTEEVLHIYGDTTLEFPETKEYVARFKKAHPKTQVLIAQNKDKNFFELCDQLGPPSRVMRWCCTIFKTGAIQRKIASLFRSKTKILTFFGIRRNESNSRNKYDRESDSPKIAIQKTVSPIIDWLDFDIWLYILTSGVDFNRAYRIGYTRVGCWCCPNNSLWSEFLSKIYMPDEYGRFHDQLIQFAARIGKPDPEVYVDDGFWKARQGGNGLEYAESTKLTFEPCALQENTLNFDLQRPITEELYELFKPFGQLNREIGNSRLGEVYVTDEAGKLLLKLQGRIGTKHLKVSILDRHAGHCNSIRGVEDKVKNQMTKYQMCIGCLGCESVCAKGAINIRADRTGLLSYRINNEKCVRCGLCISHYDGGCYMRKVVRTKRSTNGKERF